MMEKLRLQLIEDCNKSGLSIEAIYFVLKDVYRDVYDVYAKALESDKEQRQEEKEEEN